MTYSNSLLIIVFTIFTTLPSWGQCKGDFTYKTFPSDVGKASGKIEISIKSALQNFTLKVYSISGEIKLVKTATEYSNRAVVLIEGLAPSDYLVRIEWGDACNQTIGGIEGIHIVEKAD
ncbi:MAG: hypothetical protein ORN54_00475 [Cyclobacteriaceae bacterium]|nr:hypothetical protein [Cyclobacteriaceae bacterium]